MPSTLDTLFHQFAVWKGGSLHGAVCGNGIATGFPALDACLPGQGWPQAGLTELLTEHAGIGELSLLLPAMAGLSGHRGVVLVSPPFVPYAPALRQAGVDLARLLILNPVSTRDALTCAETALRSGGCGAVLVWSAGLPEGGQSALSPLALRRLHLAALRGNAMGVAFRHARHAALASPALLRILLRRAAHGLHLTLFKRRGMTGEIRLVLEPYLERLHSEVAVAPASSHPMGKVLSQGAVQRARTADAQAGMHDFLPLQ